eukprot:scaffold89866_cov26-Prasinocladus_malaysianus.AAC.1
MITTNRRFLSKTSFYIKATVFITPSSWRAISECGCGQPITASRIATSFSACRPSAVRCDQRRQLTDWREISGLRVFKPPRTYRNTALPGKNANSASAKLQWALSTS